MRIILLRDRSIGVTDGLSTARYDHPSAHLPGMKRQRGSILPGGGPRQPTAPDIAYHGALHLSTIDPTAGLPLACL